jgi:hypothetical protein
MLEKFEDTREVGVGQVDDPVQLVAQDLVGHVADDHDFEDCLGHLHHGVFVEELAEIGNGIKLVELEGDALGVYGKAYLGHGGAKPHEDHHNHERPDNTQHNERELDQQHLDARLGDLERPHIGKNLAGCGLEGGEHEAPGGVEGDHGSDKGDGGGEVAAVGDTLLLRLVQPLGCRLFCF